MSTKKAHELCETALKRSRSGDEEEAVRLWAEAAALGSARGMYNLGVVAAENGDPQAAMAWYERCLETQADYPEAHYNLALLLSAAGNEPAALEHWRAAPQAADGDAALNLGIDANEKGDTDEARRWLVIGVNSGSHGAAYNLGILANEIGEGEEAADWFRRAAEMGSPDGMNNWGAMCRIAGNIELADQWQLRGAEAGSTLAMGNLAAVAQARGDRADADRWRRHLAEALGEEFDEVDEADDDWEPSITLGHSRLHSSGNNAAMSWHQMEESAPSAENPSARAMTCTACGAARASEQRFCGSCGAPFA